MQGLYMQKLPLSVGGVVFVSVCASFGGKCYSYRSLNCCFWFYMRRKFSEKHVALPSAHSEQKKVNELDPLHETLGGETEITDDLKSDGRVNKEQL